MNFNDWYTDLLTIERNQKTVVNSVTRMEPAVVASGVFCRVYSDGGSTPNMSQTSAEIRQTMKLACDNSVTILPGDRLTITIGGRLGQSSEVISAFAGNPHHYYEPFGAVVPQIAHQEVSLIEAVRV